MPEIDWSVVQEIHAIKRQGGKLDNSEISVTTEAITIRREYKMPNGTTRIIKNSYKQDETELNADLFMLEVESS